MIKDAIRRARNGVAPWIYACILVLSAGLAASAQDRPARVPPSPAPSAPVRAQAAGTPPVLRVSPATGADPRLAEILQSVGRPSAPLSLEAKAAALRPDASAGPGSFARGPEPRLTSITLSARNPYAPNRGYLQFNEPRHIDPEANFVMWAWPANPGMAFVQATLNLEGGKRYLADFNVSTTGPQTFSFHGQQISVQAGSHHLLLILEPQGSGWTTVMLSSDHFVLHSLEVAVQD